MIKMGAPLLPRDEQGWRIPREGTLSSQIYKIYKQGHHAREIAIYLGCDLQVCRVLICAFKQPEKSNASKYKHRGVCNARSH